MIGFAGNKVPRLNFLCFARLLRPVTSSPAFERVPPGFTIAQTGIVRYDRTMTLNEIQQEAIALPERQRVDLVRALLDTLPPVGADVSDQEVAEREREMESGEIEPLSHEEFVRRVQAKRGR